MAPDADLEHVKRLELQAVIGFSGTVPHGLHVHPGGQHLVFPIGSCVVLRETADPTKDRFLLGHSDRVSCVAVGRSGRLVASGQSTHRGMQADICLFEFATGALLHRLTLHKGRVQALAFSADERYLASVGGPDDGALAIWDVEKGRPICGGPAALGATHSVAFFNATPRTLITAGANTLRIWEVDFDNRKISPTEVQLGNLQRTCKTIVIDPSDRYAFVGTDSGDLLCVQLQGTRGLKFAGPKDRLPQGVASACLIDSGDLLVGSGSGELALLQASDLKKTRTVQLQGAVTSVAAHGEHFYVGTSKANVYYVNARTFKDELRQTCHYGRINDCCFPLGYSELFATCSNHDLRVWNARTTQELLRIHVQNVECNCVCFGPDGKSIVTGWSDGRIRAFGPQTGKPLYVIHDAHKTQGMKRVSGALTGVTALAVTSDTTRLISGGADSQVRVWSIRKGSQVLEASMKEHKATVNAISLRSKDQQCVTASDDGSCIVWDLQRYVRDNILYAKTFFRAVAYFTDESQILTAGSDRKITYWDAYDCSAIRELEGAQTGEVTCLSIAPSGKTFVSGGTDKVLKLWNYDEGVCVAVGLGQSGLITRAVFAPDGQSVVSVGDEGSIYVWKVAADDQ